MLQFLPSEPFLSNELEPLISKKSKESNNKNRATMAISYTALGIHVIWTVLFIILFTTQDSIGKVETRPVENNWWTYDETTKTLTIHANVVEIGHSRELRSNKLLKSTVSNRLVVHGDVESSTANIVSNLLFHGLPIEHVLKQGPPGVTGAQGSKGDTGETGPSGSKGDTGAVGAQGAQGFKGDTGETGAQGPQGDTGENIWWTYDEDKRQLNLLTDVVDTGTIIAKNFHIKD